MKIAYLINQYPQVSHSFIRREILALERQGFQVLRIALRGWDGPLPDPEDRKERTITRYVLRGGGLGLFAAVLGAALRSPGRLLSAISLALRMWRTADRSLPYHLIYTAEACRIAQWTRAFGALRLHAHFGTNSAEIAMLAHVLGGPPYSFTAHGTDEFTRPMGMDEKIRRSSFVVAVSSFVRSQLYMRAHPADWDKVRVIHCGLEHQFYSNEMPSPTAAQRLVCVGRLCQLKGQLLLLDATARLAAKRIPFELVLAGDGPMRSDIESQIVARELKDRVRITGWISSAQVREEILAARALVLPSFSEGLPVVIMEAMALHRPVLATYIAGIPELVRHGENGWLFPAGSVDDLANAMEECLHADPATLARMGEAAYERVKERHSIDSESAKLAELFRMPSSLPVDSEVLA